MSATWPYGIGERVSVYWRETSILSAFWSSAANNSIVRSVAAKGQSYRQHSDSQGQEFLRWRQEFLNVDRQQFDPDPWHIGGKLDQIANKSIQFDHWRQKFILVASGPSNSMSGRCSG